MIDFSQIEVFSFDCYGTLIDWESGILTALQPVLKTHHVMVSDEQLLALFAGLEPKIQAGDFQNYCTVLQQVIEEIGKKFGLAPTLMDRNLLVNSLAHWPAFPDTVSTLETLKQRFRLAVISNIDDDLFSFSRSHLKVPFDWMITSQQVRSYKPSLNNFQRAIEIIGVPKEKILHVAQSIFHDIIPAQTLGLQTVWVNRRHDKPGFGATPVSQGQPDLEVPNLHALIDLIESRF